MTKTPDAPAPAPTRKLTPKQQAKVTGIGRPFEKGRSPNPGGMPEGGGATVRTLRLLSGAAIKALEDNLTDDDGKVRNTAAATILRGAWGNDPGSRIPLEDYGSLGLDDAALMQKLEAKAVAMALDGDKQILLAVLAAKDPARWGKAIDDGDDKEPPTTVNFVRDGKAREGHRPADEGAVPDEDA
jgi:hypothetical protein